MNLTGMVVFDLIQRYCSDPDFIATRRRWHPKCHALARPQRSGTILALRLRLVFVKYRRLRMGISGCHSPFTR